MADEIAYLPPAGPPPLLNQEQLISLCSQGWIKYTLPEQLKSQVQRLNSLASSFFKQSLELKENAFGEKTAEEHGYYEVPNEKEYITLRRSSTKQDELEQQAELIWHALAQFLHRVLCDFSRAGGLDPAAWNEMVSSTLSIPAATANLKDVTTMLRLFRYEPDCGTAERHTDLGLLTLCVGTGAGLEVADYSTGSTTWVDASDCAILVGETLRRLSQGGIRAGVHRVVANKNGRQSLVFALRPDLSTVVDLSCFGGDGVVSLRELFLDIKGSKFNVNAKPEVRETQRREMERKSALKKAETTRAVDTPPV